MNLYYIANYRLPTEKAHGVQILRMCRAFVAQGLDVRLIIPRRRNHIKADYGTYYGVNLDFSIVRLPTIDLIGLFPRMYLLQAISFYLMVFFFRLAHGARQTVYYTRDYLFGLFSRGHVLEMHSLPKKLNRFKLFLINRSRLIVCLTPFIKDALVKEGISEDKLIVASDAVDLQAIEVTMSQRECRQRIGLSADAKIVAYIGKYKTLEQGKGVDELIQVFPQIADQVPGVKLMIVGVQPHEVEAIRSVAQDAGLSPQYLDVIPHVPLTQIRYYFAAADIFVMNFPWTTHYAYYMSPMKLYEYMAAKRPIIATDLPSVRTILNDDNAVIIPPDNPDALLQSLTEVLRNIDRYSDRVKRAYDDVRHHTWEARVKNIIEKLRAVTS